jgi:hypothetical protein
LLVAFHTILINIRTRQTTDCVGVEYILIADALLAISIVGAIGALVDSGGT